MLNTGAVCKNGTRAVYTYTGAVTGAGDKSHMYTGSATRAGDMDRSSMYTQTLYTGARTTA